MARARRFMRSEASGESAAREAGVLRKSYRTNRTAEIERAERTYPALSPVRVKRADDGQWVPGVFVRKVNGLVPFALVVVDGRELRVAMERIDGE